MQDLTITLIQTKQFWEDKVSNFTHFESILTHIGVTDLIILPEMFHTGFTMNAMDFAENYTDSTAIKWLKNMALLKQAAIYTSLIIYDQNYFYNRGVFIEPNGKLTYYDKRKLFTLAGEEKVYRSGQERKIVEYKGWRLQLQICYDLRFPEITRNSLVKNKPLFDILLYVANWPERRATHWKSLLFARAIENQSFVVGLNRVGEDGKGLTYSGDSMVINANGECISSILPHKESIQTLTLSMNTLLEFRQQLPFLKDF
jgi:predicted amidohydrolase